MHIQVLNGKDFGKDLKDLLPQLCSSAAKTVLDIKIFDLHYRSICQRPEGFVVYAIKSQQFGAITELLNTSEPLRRYVSEERFASGQNALHCACILNAPECIGPLLSAGCKINAQNWQFNTPLHIAFQMGRLECVREFVKFFEEHPAKATTEIPKLFRVYNRNGCTVFHMAVANGCVEMVRIFLKVAAMYEEVKLCEMQEYHCGHSAAHLALLNGDYKMIELLLEYDRQACHYRNHGQNDAYDMEPRLKSIVKVFKELKLRGGKT